MRTKTLEHVVFQPLATGFRESVLLFATIFSAVAAVVLGFIGHHRVVVESTPDDTGAYRAVQAPSDDSVQGNA